MKLQLRRSNQNDLDKVHELQSQCFDTSDQMYRSNLQHYLNDGILLEDIGANKLIGVLLQGFITPCNNDIKLTLDEPDTGTNNNIIKVDINKCNEFDFYKEHYGIVMLCVDSEYRKHGYAQKLIEKHFNDNNVSSCLNTRKTNINAIELYKKMGYEHIAYIKDNYFFPNADSTFMIKEKTI